MRKFLGKIIFLVIVGVIVSMNNVRKVEERHKDIGYQQTNFSVSEETKQRLESNKRQIEKIINDEKINKKVK